MSIKFKLYSGFGLLVILAVCLVLYGVRVFDNTGFSVTRMNGIAENTSRTLLVEDYLERFRRSALRYAYDHNEASRQENEEAATKALSLLQAAEQATPSEERKKIYQEVQAGVAELRQSTRLLFDAIKQRIDAQPELLKAGTDLAARMEALNEKVRAGSDQSLINLAAKLDSQILTVRLVGLRAQVVLDVDGLPALADAASNATATMRAMEKAAPEDIRGQVGMLKALLPEYHTMLAGVVKRLLQTHDLYAKIDQQNIQMQATIMQLRKQLQENFITTQTSVETSIASTVTVQEIVAGLTLLVGGLIAFVIGRSISNPITSLTRSMKELADGNFEVMLPGLGRRDEVGDIAKAVDAFKIKAAEKAQREAAAKVEQDKRAAAEREAAMQKMAEEFQAAVGGIVQAAVAGDFSQRVNLEGKTGLVLNIGTAINSLCENMGVALDDLVKMLNALADGNLTQRITAQYQGNFALLKDNANKTAERIGVTVAEIKASAREVTNASAEISTATTDLSQRTEEQAASLEETSASMEEIAATVKKNAENAQAANQSAADTRAVAERGGQVVAEAVQAMAKIEEASQKIGDIIGVIDEIARQTNLLALNAAVEAARAGEAGRGFAVVASEVRSLAQRSSQAAKDIKNLITNSNDLVKGGVDLVSKAGASLDEIVESIKKVATIVADIAAASAEQASGVEQIGKALLQMDQVTQQNSALVEENAATAKTLETQANAMDARVGFFKIGNTAAAEAMPATATAASNKADTVAQRKPRLAAVAKPAANAKVLPSGSQVRSAPVGRMQTAVALKQDPALAEF